MARLPERVGVLGGGRMGAGIAHAFLLGGSSVRVVERDAEAAAVATSRIRAAIGVSVQRGTSTERADALIGRLEVGVTVAAFSGCGLVVEAVPEDREVKADALRAVERVLDDRAVLASNTSSLSIDGLADALLRPTRFLGLHFFNPVPSSALVEVVIGSETDPDVAEHAVGWVQALGKKAITVRDAPGFASSRLGVAIALEAIRMLEDGVASAADIDAAMVLGYRFPVGPLRLTDQVGLDVRLAIADYLHAELGERFSPPQLLRDKVAAGELGRKTGRGFFEWEPSHPADREVPTLRGSSGPQPPQTPQLAAPAHPEVP
jgi:3-hydroxybutyryl-CoA dehydrogenase